MCLKNLLGQLYWDAHNIEGIWMILNGEISTQTKKIVYSKNNVGFILSMFKIWVKLVIGN